MRDIMTYCDLNIGHSDLNPYMLVDPRGEVSLVFNYRWTTDGHTSLLHVHEF